MGVAGDVEQAQNGPGGRGDGEQADVILLKMSSKAPKVN